MTCRRRGSVPCATPSALPSRHSAGNRRIHAPRVYPACDSGARSDMQRIAYRLVDGTLKRLVWPVLDQGPQSTPQEFPLLAHVEEFRVRFFAPAGAWLDEVPGG